MTSNKRALVVMIIFYVLMSPCLLVLSCDMGAIMFGISYAIISGMVLSSTHIGREFFTEVKKSYNKIFGVI